MSKSKRILNEIKKCYENSNLYTFYESETEEGVYYIEFKIDNNDSIYFDQTHAIRFQINSGLGEFPLNPPLVRFVSKIWHPNIGEKEGTICVDILDNDWTSTTSFHNIFLSIIILLENPNLDSPQNINAKQDFEKYKNDFQNLKKIIQKFYLPFNFIIS